MDYFGWQINDMNKPLSESVATALQVYIQKHGLPEQILLETGNSPKDIFIPEGLNVVVRRIVIPKNVLLIGKL